MVTIKSYSDLQQSKKLAEILPLESADAFYIIGKEPVDIVVIYGFVTHKHLKEQMAYKRAIPCWSLAALLGVMPKDESIDCSISFGYYNDKGECIEKWLCAFEKEGETIDDFVIEAIDEDNPVDACVNMILKLNELNLL